MYSDLCCAYSLLMMLLLSTDTMISKLTTYIINRGVLSAYVCTVNLYALVYSHHYPIVSSIVQIIFSAAVGT